MECHLAGEPIILPDSVRQARVVEARANEEDAFQTSDGIQRHAGMSGSRLLEKGERIGEEDCQDLSGLGREADTESLNAHLFGERHDELCLLALIAVQLHVLLLLRGGESIEIAMKLSEGNGHALLLDQWRLREDSCASWNVHLGKNA